MGGAGIVPRRLLKKRCDPQSVRKKETIKQAITTLIAHRPEAHTHRLLHRHHAALARPPRFPRPCPGAEAERLDLHAASSAQRPCWHASDHCGEPQKCCCCSCHSCSCEAATARRRERLRAGARALHAHCDARCARGRACAAHDRLLLPLTHKLTPHICSCMLWHTTAARGARAPPSWCGMPLAHFTRWRTRVPSHARPAAHLWRAQFTQAPLLRLRLGSEATSGCAI